MSEIREPLLRSLLAGSQIRVSWYDNSHPDFYVTRTDQASGGATTGNWALYGSRQWMEIAEWPGTGLEVMHRAEG